MPIIARLLRTLDGRLRAMRWFVFVPCMAFLNLSSEMLTSVVQNLTGTWTSPGPDIENWSFGFALLIGSVVAPLIETLFQFLPLRLCMRLFGKIRTPPRWAAVVVSALLFASMHDYSADYVIRMISVGLILAYAFVVRDRPGGRPYWSVAAIHSLSNTTIICIVFAVPQS